MRVVAAGCPNCGASLSLFPEQRLCRCGYCGSALVVSWTHGEPDSLTIFEEHVRSITDGQQILLAYIRLQYIGDDMKLAEETLADALTELDTARVSWQEVQKQCTAEIRSHLAYAVAFAIAALGLWIWVFTSSRGVQVWWAVLGLIFSALALGAFSSWKTARAEAQNKRAVVEKAVQEAERKVVLSMLWLEDLEQERGECERTVRGYRYRKPSGGTQRPG